MKILIVTPSLNIHGGIRVLIEWANNLSRRGHAVTLQVESGDMRAEWIDIDEAVSVRPGRYWSISGFDAAVAGTPAIAVKMDVMQGAKKFFFLQMAEELFAPDHSLYVNTCRASYNVRMPIIGISKWVEEHVRENGRGSGPMYYIGNGVSKDFQPGAKDKELTVLVEGWEGYNPAKDTDQVGPRVAAELKRIYGARIVAYSQFAIRTMPTVPDEYHHAPSGPLLISLYQRATLMVKATRYDARSCAPVEAMACGTVTARGLIKGDDDLIHDYNCLRGGYDADEVLSLACRLIEDEALRKHLEANGRKYRARYLDWDFWMGEVEKIIEQDRQEIGPPHTEPVSRRRTL